jgi:hypothetical protein
MVYETPDTIYRDSTERFSVIGGDVGLPLVDNKALRLELYGQAATRLDDVSGWGFGAPGLLFTFVPSRQLAWFGIEYRHIKGQFEPGYFNHYYLDQRIVRDPEVVVKSQTIPDVSMNGVFGRLGVNIGDVLIASGDYQYLGAGNKAGDKDQRYEARAEIGKLLIDKIPKFTKADIYIYKTNVGEKQVREEDDAGVVTLRRDDFFEKTEHMYWGYHIGFEITKGSSLIWETRHGWKYKGNKLEKDNSVSITTAFTF